MYVLSINKNTVVATPLLVRDRVVTDVGDLDRVREEEDVARAQHICPRASPIVRQNGLIHVYIRALLIDIGAGRGHLFKGGVRLTK